MAASDQILSSILQNPPSSKAPITYQWLLPNAKGLQNYFKVMNTSRSAPDGYPSPPPSPKMDEGPALNTSSYDPNAMPSTTSGVESMDMSSAEESQKHEVSIFMAATETFSKKNTNCSIQESLDRFRPLMAESRAQNYPVRAYISVALGCPFEGAVDPRKVAEIATDLMEMGKSSTQVA